MSIVAFTSDGIKVTSTSRGVTLFKSGESWGDPWPMHDDSITSNDVDSLIQALQAVQQQKSWDNW